MAPGERSAWDWRDTSALVAIVTLAALLRAWGSSMGLPHLEARPDETEVLNEVARVAAGHFDLEFYAYPHAYVYVHWLWAEFICSLEAWFGVGSGDYLKLWQETPERAYWMGRLLTASAGVATTGLTYAIARRASDRLAAGLAAALVAVALLHVRDSHSLKPDVLMGLWATVALAAAARLAMAPTLRSAAWAGLAVGAAGAAKYNGLVSALPVAVAAWSAAPAGAGWRRVLPLPLLVAGVVALAVFVASSPFLFTNPAVAGGLGQTLAALFPFFSAPESSPAAVVVPAELVGPEASAWGATFGPFASTAYHLAFSLRHGLGWGPTLLALPALVLGLRARNPWLRACAVFCLAWFIVICATPIALSRYVTPVVAALAVLEGHLCARAFRLASARIDAPARGAVAVLLAALLLGPTAWASVRFDRLAASPDTRVLASGWLESQSAPGDRIAVHGTQFWGWGAPRVPAGRRGLGVPDADGLDPASADFLVTHDHELFWSTVDPELFRRFAAHLELVAEFDPRADANRDVTPVFETNDAFYLPVAGFAGVSAPGPHVRIYRIRSTPPNDRGEPRPPHYPARP